MIVDAHCHVSTRWYEPVETLLFQMDRCGVDKAVLVQLLGAVENDDMMSACAAHPDRFRFVAAIDPECDDPRGAMEKAADAGAAGLRFRPGFRAAKGDSLGPWRAAEEFGMAVSCVSPAAQFVDGSLEEAARACPHLMIVLEHLGGLARPDVGDRDAMMQKVLALSALPNVLLKVPGLGQLAPRRKSFDQGDEHPLELDGVHSILERTRAAFGDERLLWGSDFPPVAAREGYAQALEWAQNAWREIGADSSAIFGGNAIRVFGFPA
ncbi:amidohydrolase family protein [Hyphococcus luteus]|uniref:Amidohydrolase n=1 Tax=Hyphococcus luteus TaxID=2058213 RepID=A0A2S7K536_9PROT|nr:amidohydrolase family protein [Marinicaulis flavus]PQA87625.1 amidohydrolase [Marinicaulis flavus]